MIRKTFYIQNYKLKLRVHTGTNGRYLSKSVITSTVREYTGGIGGMPHGNWNNGGMYYLFAFDDNDLKRRRKLKNLYDLGKQDLILREHTFVIPLHLN